MSLREAKKAQMLIQLNKKHIQKRPCDALIGAGDADHCRPQDVRDYPESSNWSRLPGGEKRL